MIFERHNLYISGHGPEARLVDLDGKPLHTWRKEADEVWPERELSGQRAYWRRARLLEDGSILAMFTNLGIFKLDVDSNLVWERFEGTHHDLDLDPDGNIWLLERKAYIVGWIDPKWPVLDDYLTQLDADGNVLQRVSLLECIENSALRDELREIVLERRDLVNEREREVFEQHRELLERDKEKRDRVENMSGDIFHTNTIQYITPELAASSDLCSPGDLLICIRNLHLVALVDPQSRSVRWYGKGSWREQHETSLLANGNILLFDNLGPSERGERGYSEIIEFDPATGEVAWSYRADRRNQFFSKIAGTAARLPNGNTLVTESTHGRAFELAPDKRIVWEFWNPHRAGENDELVAMLADVVRIPAERTAGWLAER